MAFEESGNLKARRVVQGPALVPNTTIPSDFADCVTWVLDRQDNDNSTPMKSDSDHSSSQLSALNDLAGP